MKKFFTKNHSFYLFLKVALEAVVQGCSVKKVFLKISQNSQENTFPESKACNFIKKRLCHRYFPANLGKFLRTTIFIEHLWWLLLCLFLIQLESFRDLLVIHKTFFSRYTQHPRGRRMKTQHIKDSTCKLFFNNNLNFQAKAEKLTGRKRNISRIPNETLALNRAKRGVL